MRTGRRSSHGASRGTSVGAFKKDVAAPPWAAAELKKTDSQELKVRALLESADSG